jgi:hypothetical protein
VSHDRRKQKKLAEKKARRADVRTVHIALRRAVRDASKAASRQPVPTVLGAIGQPVDATSKLLDMDLSALYGSEPGGV